MTSPDLCVDPLAVDGNVIVPPNAVSLAGQCRVLNMPAWLKTC